MEDNIKLHIHAHGCHKINKHVMSQVGCIVEKVWESESVVSQMINE